MTDRHTGYVVALADDIRDDDAQAVVNALRMVKGVIGVEPVIAEPITEQVARMRADKRWRDGLFTLIHDIHEGPRAPDAGGV